MLATVSQSRSLRSSFLYAVAYHKKEEKGGMIVACSNGFPPTASNMTQLHFLEAVRNDKYEVQAINIIISHSKEDAKFLKDHPDKQKKYVEDFLKEFTLLHKTQNGTKSLDEDHSKDFDKDSDEDLEINKNCYYAIAEHDNTECLHYHMVLLTTLTDGSRLNTQYIGAHAAKAAYRVSVKNNLHYATRWDKKEEANVRYQSEKAKNESSDGDEGKENLQEVVGLSDQELAKLKEIGKGNKVVRQKISKKKQQQSIEAGKQRRAWIKNVVENVAKHSNSYQEMLADLLNNGIIFSGEDEKSYSVSTIREDGKQVSYKLFRLGIDSSLIKDVKSRELEEEERVAKAEKKREDAAKRKAEQERQKEQTNNEPKEDTSIKRGGGFRL